MVLQLLPQHENRDLLCMWGEHMVCFHPCTASISAEFSADSSSQSRRNWHNVYYLEGLEIKTNTPMVPLNKVSKLRKPQKGGQIANSKGGRYAFYRMVLREYYLWAIRKKKNQIAARKKCHCLGRD